jgi:hypothetical protein
MVVLVTPVSVLVAVIETPGISARLVSSTVPPIEEFTCANPTTAKAIHSTAAAVINPCLIILLHYADE